MKRIANPIETAELCSYGCGNVARFVNGSNNLMCCECSNLCPSIRLKNSIGGKRSYVETGRDQSKIWHSMSDENKKKCNHNKGKFTADFSYDGKGNHKIVLILERGHTCESCKLSTWLDKDITLELEHIDGDNKNNCEENLKLLCPNCHSQTSTWRRKKSKLQLQKCTDEEIIEAIKTSMNIHQVLQKLDLRYGSASTIVNVMFKYKIDFGLEKPVVEEKIKNIKVARKVVEKQPKEIKVKPPKVITANSHSDETIEKMRNVFSSIKHQQGKKNSQFGTMWIHNFDEKTSKKIKIDDFQLFEETGWLKGRKMKF